MKTMLLPARRFRFLRKLRHRPWIVLTVGTFTGCSVYMEANRPTPVNLAHFQPGQARDYVLEQLGPPPSSAMESDGASCDFYKLYTRGYGAGGKIPIAIAEGAADVVTFGLAEVISTPIEGATKNELHPVSFCYKNDSLVRVVGPAPTSTDDAAPPTAETGDSGVMSTVNIPPSEPAPLNSPPPAADSGPNSPETE